MGWDGMGWDGSGMGKEGRKGWGGMGLDGMDGWEGWDGMILAQRWRLGVCCRESGFFKHQLGLSFLRWVRRHDVNLLVYGPTK